MVNIERLKNFGSLMRPMSFLEKLSLMAHIADYCFNVILLGRKEVVRRVNGYEMLLSFREPGISKELILFRNREELEVEIVQSILKPGMRVLEVGANIGFYTIFTAKLIGKNGKIYAYEPFPPSYKTLVENIKLSGISEIVHSRNMAVSDETKTRKLFLGKGSNVHSFSVYAQTDQYVEVPCIDINELLADIGEPVDLMRMDVEGHERQLFARLDKAVAPLLPKKILFEIHPVGDMDPDPSFDQPLQNLLDLGYTPEKVVSSTNLDAKERFEKLNYLPNRFLRAGASVRYVYDDIKPEDFLKVAARRPKMTRAILLKRDG